MRTLSLSWFYKFIEIRACGSQCLPDAIFWLKLVSVLGLKIVILLKNSKLEIKKELLSTDTDQKDLVWISTQT